MNSPAEPLPLLTRGHPLLNQPSMPVSWPDDSLAGQLRSLHATLADFRARHGFGRAMSAVQAGIARRVIVMDLGAGPLSLINPEITWRSEETFVLWDDCLSVPGLLARVRRHRSISLRYLDEAGRVRHWERLPEELAELMQHEIDHLDGVLMDQRAEGENPLRPMSERATLVDSQRRTHRLSLERMRRAADDIAPEFLNSPQYDCEPLSQALGLSLTIKLDFANPIRSFKGRGAGFLLGEWQRRGEHRPLVCASAGNWGQAMAYVCRAQGRPLVIHAAVAANPLKVARMQALGATVVLQGHDFDAAKAAARAHAERIGGVMVEDGLEPEISEGHATLAIELLSRGDAFDAVVLPLGNGALLAGVARWMKAASPATQVFGVCAKGAPSMERSWRQQQRLCTATADTIADGIAVREPIPQALDDLQGLIDGVLLVSDDQIRHAMRQACTHAGLLLEPAGAAGLAGVWVHRERWAGGRVATVLCGSNLTAEHMGEAVRAP